MHAFFLCFLPVLTLYLNKIFFSIGLQAPGMAQLKAVATKYQQRLPQPGDPRYYRKAGTGGGEVPGLKAPVAVPAKARKASVHKSEPVFVSHKKEGAASSAGAYRPRAGVNPAAVYQVYLTGIAAYSFFCSVEMVTNNVLGV